MVLSSKEDFRKLLSPEIDNKLRYEEDARNKVIRVIPLEFLSKDHFTEIATVIRQLGGDYVSAGRNSHFAVPYEPPPPRELREQEARNLELAGRYEDAAQIYETLGMYEKAGELRRLERTHYVISTNFQIGKDGGISLSCPHCGASQPAESKSTEVTCKYCGRIYLIPKKILDMI